MTINKKLFIKNPRHAIEERLNRLHALKSNDDLVEKQKERKIRNKIKRLTDPVDDKTDFKTDLAFSVKTTKDAELLAGMPEYNWIPLNNEGRKLVKLLKHIWAYRWLTSNTDKVLSKVVPSATAYGTGWMYEGIKTTYRKIKEPSYDEEGIMTFEEKVVKEYDGIYCEYIPWENIFIDGTDMDNANEVVWIKYWDRTDFIKEYELNPKYKNVSDASIPKTKEYSVVQGVDDPKDDREPEEIITEMRYYNRSMDEMIILANGVEVYNTPIPFTHKELPFCPYLDYMVDGRLYGMGEYELLEEDEQYADALRSLSIDVIKAQMGTTFIEEDLDLDDSIFEYGTNTYTRVDNTDKVKFYAPNIGTASIDNAEAKLDNTVISKTGVNHRAQTLDPSETATKTAAKNQAARKRINLNLKINGYYFFERLARLRLANLKLLHSKGTKDIFIEGGNIDKYGNFEPVNGGYGSFTITPDFIKGEYSVVPITESILGSTEERMKQRFLEFVQVMGGIPGADGKPVLRGENIVEIGTELWNLDYDKLTGAVEAEKNPEDLVKNAIKQNQGVSIDATDPASPEFIPAEQRSGAPSKGLSGAQNIKDTEILE